MVEQARITETVQVWDPLVRILHWSLAVSFFVAYLTEDELTVHVYAGYVLAGVVGVRLVWGVVGTRHARFADFVTRPSTVFAYLGLLGKGRPPHYVGHNPAGGAMVVALLICLVLTVVLGMALIAHDGSGPLAGTLVTRFPEDWLEESHEVLANLTLFLVAFHVAGVVLSSYLEGQNLVKAMFTGHKRAL
jgi:cytochrome b